MIILTPENKRNIFEILPQDIKDFILSPARYDAMDLITKENSLDKEGSDLVEKAISLVLFGIITPYQFKEQLVTDLRIDNRKLEKVSSEVSSEIFSNIEESLNTIDKIKIQEIIKEETPPETGTTQAPLNIQELKNIIDNKPQVNKILGEMPTKDSVEIQKPTPKSPTIENVLPGTDFEIPTFSPELKPETGGGDLKSSFEKGLDSFYNKQQEDPYKENF